MKYEVIASTGRTYNLYSNRTNGRSDIPFKTECKYCGKEVSLGMHPTTKKWSAIEEIDMRFPRKGKHKKRVLYKIHMCQR